MDPHAPYCTCLHVPYSTHAIALLRVALRPPGLPIADARTKQSTVHQCGNAAGIRKICRERIYVYHIKRELKAETQTVEMQRQRRRREGEKEKKRVGKAEVTLHGGIRLHIHTYVLGVVGVCVLFCSATYVHMLTVCHNRGLTVVHVPPSSPTINDMHSIEHTGRMLLFSLSIPDTDMMDNECPCNFTSSMAVTQLEIKVLAPW